MNHLNSVLIEGNLIEEPLFRSSPAGTPVCTFRFASHRTYKQASGLEEEVSFFNVETSSNLAEHNLGHKGQGVRVVGRLKEERWCGTDGETHSNVTIVAEHVEFRPETK